MYDMYKVPGKSRVYHLVYRYNTHVFFSKRYTSLKDIKIVNSYVIDAKL